MTTRRQLVNMLAAWQGRLGLDAWRITVELVHARELDVAAGTFGATTIEANVMRARVRIVDPAELGEKAHELELTLVHELVHVCLYAWEPAGAVEAMLLEQTVEQLALALLDRERRAA